MLGDPKRRGQHLVFLASKHLPENTTEKRNTSKNITINSDIAKKSGLFLCKSAETTNMMAITSNISVMEPNSLQGFCNETVVKLSKIGQGCYIIHTIIGKWYIKIVARLIKIA